jgi:ribosomal protein L11 methyltransferase
VKTWPAADVRVTSDPDHVIAAVDDFSPTAAEERGDILRVFFASSAARDGAVAALGSVAIPVDVDDEDWAARSQADLAPITVGRLVVLPSEQAPSTSPGLTDDAISIVIRPSMGFGTGHHATTRLCLAALQDEDVSGRTVLDVGTGSGILAIAASRLGAARAIGIDTDPDAIDSANLNLTLNPDVGNVRFVVGDPEPGPLESADIVLANLTGALLVRTARTLLAAVRPGGTLIVSGILDEEEAAVRQACSGALLRTRRQEGEWIGLAFNPGVSSSV